nr:MAG TPA: hypothetical protein [Caudoviricetes sp.]
MQFTSPALNLSQTYGDRGNRTKKCVTLAGKYAGAVALSVTPLRFFPVHLRDNDLCVNSNDLSSWQI